MAMQGRRKRVPRSSARRLYLAATVLIRRRRQKEKNRLGGQRNPLKMLDSDKEIKGNPRVFL
jgi:hypothetical protein